ncbi:MAG: hypothetical protein J5870_07905 [Clostridia bacterium]|nr:hypothetical protein [Clostridia bacterium]MBR5771648.1 hypothetical protein [Clostridia bacterium]
MFCPNCGSKLDDSGKCPNCSAVPAKPEAPAPAPQQAPVNKAPEPEEKKGITKGSRTYCALVSAALVFPASLSVAIDLSFHRYDFWFGYFVGAVLVAWVCLVLPALKITPPPVTAIICFVTMMGYVFYVMYKLGHLEWLFNKALPLTILFIVFVSIDIMLVSYKKVNWLAVLGLISFETGIYLVAIEATYTGSLQNLHWSPILACGFISVAAVLVAFAYIGNMNRKGDKKSDKKDSE